MAIDNKDKKVLKSSIEREQNEVACSAECEKIKGSKNLNVPPLRFPEFSGEWKCTTIGNIGDIKNGPFGSVLHAEDYVENGIPIVTTEHFKTGLMPSDKFGIPQVSNEDYIRLKGYRLETNDIVFSRVGSVDINAHVGIEQNGWLFSGRVLRVRPKYDIDSLFLHYALSTEAVKRDIRNRAVGQTMPSINTPILSSTTIQLPKDLFEQKKVAHFLRLLDERIITQNKIIEKLQSLIKGLRVCCMQRVYGNNVYLSEIAQIYQPQTISSTELTEDGFLVYGANGIIGKYKDYNHETEQICITCRGNTCGMVNYTKPMSWITGNAMVINTDKYQDKVCKRYLYHYLSAYNFNSIISGSGQPQIVRTPLEKLKITLPTISEQKQKAIIFDKIQDKIDINHKVLNLYIGQKQYLLRQMFI
ncbi:MULTISPECIES: restriction endonuclease subunit S [Bacteroides]|uniref:restriction endonuclease subunit S n=1 Tax=Bacteroides TaxID=816 RepID=UPI001FB2FAA8|nr:MULTISPECIES: restriction endonuclease subunit S [Bacteroides]WII05165.1 restriction endonuclease subunit S [Bacteroides ovatus]